MTPERQKWWNTLSVSEKYLRLELDAHRCTIKEYKKTLNNKVYRDIIGSLYDKEEYYMIQDAKDKITKSKILSSAIKHEIELKRSKAVRKGGVVMSKYFYYENVNSMDGHVNGFGVWKFPTKEAAVKYYYDALEEDGDQLHVLRLYEITKDEHDAFPHTCPDDSQLVYDDYDRHDTEAS